MKNNVPLIYWTFRTAWTLLHFVVVAVAAAALLTWALADNHALRAFEPARDNVLTLQERVSNVIPWPWATGGGGGNDSQSTAPSQNSQTTAPPQNDSRAQSGEYQVIGNVNVRTAPQLSAKVVKALTDASWIRINCTTEGPSVNPGPYQTSLTAYQGKDFPASSIWDHVPGLGYISDAYVSTSNGGGLPAC